MKQIQIPSTLSHLKKDDRGYPIPYFVAWVNGKPDFRMLDQKKQVDCVEKQLCGVCGKPLDIYGYFITGPMGQRNSVHSDPPMHKECAEYSIETCPHLHFEKAKRNEREDYYKDAKKENTAGLYDKPNTLYLIKAITFWLIPGPTGKLVQFKEVSKEKYVYINGTLQKE